MFYLCAGLWDLELDIDHLSAVKDDQELRLEKEAEALRTIKAKNEQVRSTACRTVQLPHCRRHTASPTHQTCKQQQTAYTSA